MLNGTKFAVSTEIIRSSNGLLQELVFFADPSTDPRLASTANIPNPRVRIAAIVIDEYDDGIPISWTFRRWAYGGDMNQFVVADYVFRSQRSAVDPREWFNRVAYNSAEDALVVADARFKSSYKIYATEGPPFEGAKAMSRVRRENIELEGEKSRIATGRVAAISVLAFSTVFTSVVMIRLLAKDKQ